MQEKVISISKLLSILVSLAKGAGNILLYCTKMEGGPQVLKKPDGSQVT